MHAYDPLAYGINIHAGGRMPSRGPFQTGAGCGTFGFVYNVSFYHWISQMLSPAYPTLSHAMEQRGRKMDFKHGRIFSPRFPPAFVKLPQRAAVVASCGHEGLCWHFRCPFLYPLVEWWKIAKNPFRLRSPVTDVIGVHFYIYLFVDVISPQNARAFRCFSFSTSFLSYFRRRRYITPRNSGTDLLKQFRRGWSREFSSHTVDECNIFQFPFIQQKKKKQFVVFSDPA